MRPVLKAFLRFVGLALVMGLAVGLYLFSTALNARDTPGALETTAALTFRNFVIRFHSRNLRNPVERAPEVIASGRGHFADHCASCHANNGSGDTTMGRGLYPKVPDMRLARTQDLSDGALFHIIENGVRFTGMPAWGTGDASGEMSSWHLVHFIRHLPELSEPELAEMESLNPVPADEVRQRMLEEEFLKSGGQPSEAAATPASPHKH